MEGGLHIHCWPPLVHTGHILITVCFSFQFKVSKTMKCIAIHENCVFFFRKSFSRPEAPSMRTSRDVGGTVSPGNCLGLSWIDGPKLRQSLSIRPVQKS